MAISDYSTTPGNNNSAPPNGAPEGMQAGQTNNVIRQIMADIKTWYDTFASGTFVATYSGFSSPPNTTISYSVSNGIVLISLPSFSTGTSNSAGFTFDGMPAALRPSAQCDTTVIGLIDNGAALTTPSLVQIAISGTVSLYKDASGATWTPSGSKGFTSNRHCFAYLR